VNVPSRTDPTAAPTGCDTLFVLIPLAPGLEDAPERREVFYGRIMDDLEAKLGTEIRPFVEVKRFFALNDFKDRYNAYKGTALGLSHTLRQTALFRPAHASKKADNLYYTGHYCHPGIGVPMVLISSQIVRDLIRERAMGAGL
jgi:phytoene desaturase